MGALRGRLLARWSAAPRGLVVALAVGALVRIAWVVWAARPPADALTDPGQYLTMADGFAMGRWPTIGAYQTAFYPPGWSMLLAPAAWLAMRTGWFELMDAAVALNVVLGTASIWLTARLATRWMGGRAAVPAAWIMAVSPPAVFYTSTALAETAATALVLWSLDRAGGPDDGPAAGSSGRGDALLAAGALAGAAVLVRTSGLALVALPWLLHRARGGRWRGAGATARPFLAGLALVLLPWGLVSGLVVGHWSPLPSGGASALCTGHRDGATGRGDNIAECYVGSVFDQPSLYPSDHPGARTARGVVDEQEWYRRTSAEALRWALTHPGEELRLVAAKTWALLSNQRDALIAAEDWNRNPLVGPRLEAALQALGDLWLWSLYALVAVALRTRPRARRAVPVWGLPLVFLLIAFAGVAFNRYAHPIWPLLAVLAAASWVPGPAGRPLAADDPPRYAPEHVNAC